MNIAMKGLVFGVSALALSFARVSLADAPKSVAVLDPKDSRVVNIVATLPDGPSKYRCQYQWKITFRSGAETSDACEVDVPAGTKNTVVCVRKYDSKIVDLALLQANYRAL
ncbi:MAG TPA: hypothetical protein VMC02_14405 [Steroidobacteraceae bacterium]|nr:hypothetical protein [Steroidobacteraceae bacterium]